MPCSAASPTATRKGNRDRSCWRQVATTEDGRQFVLPQGASVSREAGKYTDNLVSGLVMHMAGLVRMAMIVVVRVRVVMRVRRPGRGIDLDVHGAHAALDHHVGAQAPAADAQPIQDRANDLGRNARIDQGAQGHVAGRAAGAIEVQVRAAQRMGLGRAARRRLRCSRAHVMLPQMRAAPTAAPKPLSMLTTSTPAAHDDSMPRSAA